MDLDFDRAVNVSPDWANKCAESLHDAVLKDMREQVIYACVRNQMIVCQSSYADESQMARDWVDESSILSVAEHLTNRQLIGRWHVEFKEQR